MKNVSLENIKKAGKWAVPAGVIALAVVSQLVAQPGKSPAAAVTGVDTPNAQSQATESPAPAAAAQVTVNGQAIPTDKQGTTDLDVPGGKAHVNVAGGSTTVTTSDNGTTGDTSNNQSGNVNLSVNSNSNGGSNWGSTQVYGFSSNSNASGASFNSTSIFSTGADNVSVSTQ